MLGFFYTSKVRAFQALGAQPSREALTLSLGSNIKKVAK